SSAGEKSRAWCRPYSIAQCRGWRAGAPVKHPVLRGLRGHWGQRARSRAAHALRCCMRRRRYEGTLRAVNELWLNNGVARPRKITDKRLLTAAETAITRLGPAFTLADVAREAQVAAGTLVQRFGSKHGMLGAMTKAAIAPMQRALRAAVADVDDPVAAVLQALVGWYAPLDDPHSAANNLAQLASDLPAHQPPEP